MNKLFNENTDPLLESLFITGIALIAGLLIYRVFSGKLNKYIKENKESSTILLVLYQLKGPVFFLIIFITLAISFPFSHFPQHILGPLRHACSIALIITIAWLCIRSINLGKHFMLQNYNLNQSDNLKARKVYTQFRVIEQILDVLIVVIAIATCLMTFEKIRQIGYSMLASAGVMGIIIGFAAQKSISTIIAGIQIALTQPIRVEDVVIVEGEWGWIEEISLTYVVVRIWDKRRLVVPVTYFLEKPFQNWTRESADILGAVFIYTDYNVPFDEIRAELTRIVENNSNWDGKVNIMQVTDTNDKAVEVRLLVSASDAPSAWNLRVHVREQMIKFLQNHYPESLPRTRIKLLSDSENPMGE